MYRIDFNKFNNSFFDKAGFKNRVEVEYMGLPYTLTTTEKIINLKNVIGEFIRIILQKKLKDISTIDEVIEQALSNISLEYNLKSNLRSILQELFIEDTEKKEMCIFNTKAYAYVPCNSSEKKIAKFLYDILVDEQIEEKTKSTFDGKSTNILYEIIFASLTELTDDEPRNKEYVNSVCYVKERFKEDFIYLLKNQKLLHENLNRFLSFYYFFYVSQLIIKTSQMFKGDGERVEEVYFAINNEKLSLSRICYEKGWSNLVIKSEKIASHMVTLNLINTSNDENKYDYISIKNMIENMNDSDKSYFYNDIEQLTDEYIKNIKDIELTELKKVQNKNNSEDIFGRIATLYDLVDYQFVKSKRSRSANAYSDSFKLFGIKNYCKSRGNLGNNLYLVEENLLFLTKLILKDNEKLKLKIMFEEFNMRGVFFDKDTKKHLISYYESINILDKKSDSGDAQYVKNSF